MRFEEGEIALIYSRHAREPYTPADGTEVTVIAVGPFPAGYSRQIGGRVVRWHAPGDYIIDCPGAWGMCFDSDLRKRRPPIPNDVLETFKTKDQAVPA